MCIGVTTIGLFSFVSGIFGGNAQKKAADQAAKLQYDSNMAGLNETRRQFDITRADFNPVLSMLPGSAKHLGDLSGINGNDALMAEIMGIKSSPRYTQTLQNGRDEMLAQASATGGLRGGNYQDAAQRFGGDTLSSQIQQQLGEYAGLVGLGTNAAGAVGNFGANAVANENTLRNGGADALAQAKLVRGGINAKNWGNAGSLLDGAFSAATGGVGGGLGSQKQQLREYAGMGGASGGGGILGSIFKSLF